MGFKKQSWVAFILFGLTLVLAFSQHWNAHDIVWSMWISSLVLGYAFVLGSIGARIFKSQISENKKMRVLTWLGRTTLALPMLAFFTFHFCFFHIAHARILSDFFPLLPGVSSHGVRGEGLFRHFGNFIEVTLRQYWPFVLISGVRQYEAFCKALASSSPETMTLWAYARVMRNHLMIFVCAFLNQMGLNALMLLSVLILYFFPFSALFPAKREEEAKV